MIAEISQPFSNSSLSQKINYQLRKIDSDKGHYLYSSIDNSPLEKMELFMNMTAESNEKVKNPYIEIVVSLVEGEHLTDEKFIELAKDYMTKMGYADSCYLIAKNNDTDNEHIHILATTIEMNSGKWISDSNNRNRSYAISRDLEQKYNLKKMEKKGFSKTTLGEAKHREYYFDNALNKALKNNVAKSRIEELISESEFYKEIKPHLKNGLTNDEWQTILGVDLFERVGEVLSRGKFFNTLWKDELLNTLDRVFPTVNNASELREALEKEGYYMRLVSNKGKANYVYGIEDQNIYFKDSSLPRRYRYGNIIFNGLKMNPDEQKHVLYNQLFSVLNSASNYEDFKLKLKENNINVTEHINKTGIYGLSFTLKNVENPHEFKASEISNKLSYKNINRYFEGENKEADSLKNVVRNVNQNAEMWSREMNAIYSAAQLIAVTDLMQVNHEKNHDDDLNNQKKKKKINRNKGISR